MRRLFIVFPFLLALLFVFSCQEKKSDIAEKKGLYEVSNQSACVGCHTDKALLEKVAEPLENEGGASGEG